MVYSVTKLGDTIDWNQQRTNFIKSVAGNRHRHRGQKISVRIINNGNDDAYDGGIDDTLHDASVSSTSAENADAHDGGGMDIKDTETTTAGNDDAYSGGIDDTLGITSVPISSFATGNDDAYVGKMDDTLDGHEVALSATSQTNTTESGGEDDEGSETPISNRHANVEGQIVKPYLRYDRHRHRRLQGNDIDGDVFDGYEYDQGACPNAGSLDVPCAPLNLSSICNKYDSVSGSFKECLEACKPAFCCIHDAPRETNYLSPNCNTDENCPQYSYCYIVWWKLHDTVGPALFMRVDQDDKFYDGAEDVINTDIAEDPFMTQVLLHHFDDIDRVIEDGTVDNEFDADRIFLDEEYWMYPESEKVDVND